MRVTPVIVAAVALTHAFTASGANGKSCAEVQKEYTHWYSLVHWNLDKVHKVFGQPSSIQRGVYAGSECFTQKCDVLNFNFGGCYFHLFIDGSGRAGKTDDGFHFQPSELLGKSTPGQPPQPRQVDAVYASMQALEGRTKNLESAVARLSTLIAALQAALAGNEDAKSARRGSPAPLSITVPSSGAPGEYLGLGSGHWIEEVSSNGRVIELEDGSLWEVESADQVDTALWLPITDISVQRASASGEYRYLLINKEDGEKASAKFLGMG